METAFNLSTWLYDNAIAIIVVVVGTLGGGWITQRVTKKYSRENQFMDQQQEQIDSLSRRLTEAEASHRVDREELRRQMSDLASRMEAENVLRRLWQEEYYKLRHHVLNGNPPPPPDLPEALTRIQSNNH